MKEIIKELKKLKIGNIKTDVELCQLTTYRQLGVVPVVVFPNNIESLIKTLEYLKSNKVKYMVVGNGSNLVFINDNYDGVLIKLTDLNHLEVKDEKVVVGSGYNLTKLAIRMSSLGLAGLEFAAGIPGTIGGAVYMNAGAYNSDMGYIVSEIKILNEDLEVKTIYNRDLDFHYRTSILQKNKNWICLEATIILKNGDRKEITDLISERKQRRLMSQPLEYPSAGSVFRNPVNDYAGRLIESLDYKGFTIGGAMVSEKHANFIINYNKASGKDIKKLIDKIIFDVKDKYNIELRVEQEYVE